MAINNVLVLGSSEYAKRIGALFIKAGANTQLVADGSKQNTPADLVIEAVDGNVEVKRQALARLSMVTPEVILATTYPGEITAIASGNKHEARTIGLNFIFNPLEEKCLAQIVKGLETLPDVIDQTRQIVDKTGAVAVIVENVSGLIIDRVLASTINEAALMLQTKVASMEDINRLPKLCLNWPMGPFDFADYLGIDSVVATLEAALKESPQYLPCRLLREMIAAGRLGRKTGRGFFEYPKEV